MKILVTGMSGTGKSSALAELARHGHRVVDTDYGSWSEYGSWTDEDGFAQVWNAPAMETLLADHVDGTLFVGGCVSNQGRFYPLFDAIVLLSAPEEVILERIATRTTNPFGKTDAQRARIIDDLRSVEPLLRSGATAEIDTTRPLSAVVDELLAIARIRQRPC